MSIQFLCCEGGGVTGIAAAGAAFALEQAGELNELKGAAGTSAGAILAVLLQLGYSAMEINEELGAIDFSDFMDDDFGVVRDTARFFNSYGYYKGDFFREWLESLLRKKGYPVDVTFEEVKEATGRVCRVAVTNLNRQKSEIYGSGFTPKMGVVHAVRCSMSIPFFFEAQRNEVGDLIVDGGVTMNFPLRVFDADYPGENVVGIRLDSKEEIDAANSADNWDRPDRKIGNIVNFASAVIGHMRAAAHQSYLSSRDLKRTIFVPTLGVGATEFKISKGTQNALFHSGIDAVLEWKRRKEVR